MVSVFPETLRGYVAFEALWREGIRRETVNTLLAGVDILDRPPTPRVIPPHHAAVVAGRLERCQRLSRDRLADRRPLA